MFDIIYNPTSKSGSGVKIFNEFIAEFDKRGVEYKLHKTEHKNHATEIVRELNKTQDDSKVLIFGGDGTFGEALMGIENFDTIALGLVPCGTGNDYARAMKFPSKTVDFVEQFIKGEVRRTDYIQINDDLRCLNVSGLGMDVDILERYADIKEKKGKASYFAALLWVVLHLKFHKIRYTIDGVTEDRDILITSIANGLYVGGGLNMSPNSVIGDGLLNVVMIDKLKKGQKYPMLFSYLKTKHLSRPETREFVREEFDLEILDNSKFQIDGELYDLKKIHCKLVHDKLRILN